MREFGLYGIIFRRIHAVDVPNVIVLSMNMILHIAAPSTPALSKIIPMRKEKTTPITTNN
jgi:hypothetical protein